MRLCFLCVEDPSQLRPPVFNIPSWVPFRKCQRCHEGTDVRQYLQLQPGKSGLQQQDDRDKRRVRDRFLSLSGCARSGMLYSQYTTLCSIVAAMATLYGIVK